MTLLYIEQSGNIFTVRVRTTLLLNAWQGTVVLPNDLVVQSVAYGGSIGNVWQTAPTLSGRTIVFAGGNTTPFTGDGALFSFTAGRTAVSAAELIRFDAPTTQLYAADGTGTAVGVTLQPITINARDLLTATTTTPVADKVAPAPFSILVVHDANIFDGQPAAVFSATDAGSGIDHYEVEEYTQSGTISWHTATSPYLIDPKTTILFVKAVDRAGNMRVEDARFAASGIFGGMIAAVVGGLLVVALLLAYFFRRWKKQSAH